MSRDDKVSVNSERVLTEPAKRALAEAEARRAKQTQPEKRPRELAGRKGPEPVRFGDWENKGLATDF